MDSLKIIFFAFSLFFVTLTSMTTGYLCNGKKKAWYVKMWDYAVAFTLATCATIGVARLFAH